MWRKVWRKLIELEMRLDAVEERLPEHGLPPTIDVPTPDFDPQAIWRGASGDYASGRLDDVEDWNPRRYL